jgi:hypothetical protein
VLPKNEPLITPVDDSNNFFCNTGDMMGRLSTELYIGGEAVSLRKSWSRGCPIEGGYCINL